MLPGFLNLLFWVAPSPHHTFFFFYHYGCLPQAVFLQYPYICKSPSHRCAVLLAYTFPSSLLSSPEGLVFSCVGRRVSTAQLQQGAASACSPHALEKHSRSYFDCLCSFGFLESLFSWKRFHSVPHRGLAALNSLHLLLQKLSVSLRPSAAAVLRLLCQPHLFGLLYLPLGSSYLLPAP